MSVEHDTAGLAAIEVMSTPAPGFPDIGRSAASDLRPQAQAEALDPLLAFQEQLHHQEHLLEM